MAQDLTTIQVSRDCAERLKVVGRGAPYEQTIRQLMGAKNMREHSEVLTFRKTVAALAEESEEQRISTAGRITSVIMDFPSGCEFLVYVRLVLMTGNNKDYVVPSTDDKYIIMDDANPHFTINYPVEPGQRLRAEWQNFDGLNPHTVVVIATISPQLGV